MQTITRKYAGTIKWKGVWFQVVPETTSELGRIWEQRHERRLKVFLRPLAGDEYANRILLYADERCTEFLAAADKMRGR
jgi:hypothetical protein